MLKMWLPAIENFEAVLSDNPDSQAAKNGYYRASLNLALDLCDFAAIEETLEDSQALMQEAVERLRQSSHYDSSVEAEPDYIAALHKIKGTVSFLEKKYDFLLISALIQNA